MVWPLVPTINSVPSGAKSTVHADPDAGAIAPRAARSVRADVPHAQLTELSDARQPVAVTDELGVP